MATRNLTIMFTDIKGFTERTSESTRQGMKALLSEHERLLVPVFRYFDGTIVKTIGDAFLVYFESPTDAVLCGVTIQEVLRQHNTTVAPHDRLEVRVSINVGEVELSDGDVLGEAVNIAARLEGVTEAGEVWFTDAVYQTMNRSEAPSAEVGERIFKGIPHPIRVYKVVNTPGTVLSEHLSRGVHLSKHGPVLEGIREQAAPRSKRPYRALLIALAIATAIALFMLTQPDARERARHEALALMEQGSYASALEVLHQVLVEQPGDQVLAQLALMAAEGHLQQVGELGGYIQAMSWLQRALEQRPYLEPLRSHIVTFDADITVGAMLVEGDPGVVQPESLKAFLNRYPRSQLAPYAAALRLEGEGYPDTRLWLFQVALENGHPADDAVFDFCIELLSGGALYWPRIEQAQSMVLRYYTERAVEWARQAIDGGRVLAFVNGWAVLEQSISVEEGRDYYLALRGLVLAQDVAVVDAAAGLLQAQPPGRRPQVLALLAELSAEPSPFVSHRQVRERIAALYGELQRAWSEGGSEVPVDQE